MRFIDELVVANKGSSMAPGRPTFSEFRDLLRAGDLTRLVTDYILGASVPAAFETEPGDYEVLLQHLGDALGLNRENLALVGSGRIGFSLSPEKFGAPFSEQSDLDVAVVAPELFDTAWLELVKTRPWTVRPPRVRAAFDEHRTKWIFYGRMKPLQLGALLSLRRRWFNAFQSTGEHPELAAHEVHGMLFRSWEHVTAYHEYGLGLLRAQLRSPSPISSGA